MELPNQTQYRNGVNNHQALTAENRKLLNEKKYPFELTAFEVAVIKQMRKIPRGSITIHMMEFIPQRYTIGADYLVDPVAELDTLITGEELQNG